MPIDERCLTDLWIDCFAPTEISEVVECDNARKMIALHFGSSPLLFVGPSGVGKSLIANILLKSFSLVEISPATENHEKELDKFFECSVKTKGISAFMQQIQKKQEQKKEQALLVEEADFLEGRILACLNKHLRAKTKTKSYYIIIICNQAQVPSLRTLKNYAEIVYFNKISDSGIFDRLVNINKKSGKHYTKKSELNSIVSSANGDLRQAITIMQMQNAKPSENTPDKNLNLTNNLFDFGTYLLSKETSDSLIKNDIFLATNLLHENFYRQKFTPSKTHQYIAKFTNTLSDLDLLDSIYATEFQASIISINCNKLQSKYKKPIARVNFPSILGHISSKSAALKNNSVICRVIGHSENYFMLQRF